MKEKKQKPEIKKQKLKHTLRARGWRQRKWNLPDRLAPLVPGKSPPKSSSWVQRNRVEINHNEKLNRYTCTGAVATGLEGLRHRYECGDPWNWQTLILRSKQEWNCSLYNSKTGSIKQGVGLGGTVVISCVRLQSLNCELFCVSFIPIGLFGSDELLGLRT